MYRYRIQQLRLPLQEKERFRFYLSRRLALAEDELLDLVPVRLSLDNRKGHSPSWIYQLEFSLRESILESGDLKLLDPLPNSSPLEELGQLDLPEEVQIVGAGPAGLWAAFSLLRRGYRVVLHERGRPVEERFGDIRRFVKQGKLDPESNVLFGEGGAGAFSDGKLTSRGGNIFTRQVLKDLVECGAPPETLYYSRAHLGTERLYFILRELRRRILSLGGEIRFGSRLDDLEIVDGELRAIHLTDLRKGESHRLPTETLILASGHSARDLYRMLHERGVPLEPKAFAVGVRVEHPQELIDRRHFSHPKELQFAGPAEYQLRADSSRGGAYSFCMCPGGVLVPCSNRKGELATNGMSYSRRNSRWANSGIVVPVDLSGEGLWAGIDFQEQLERRAFELGGGSFGAPAQSIRSMIDDRLDRAPLQQSSWPNTLAPSRLSELFGEKLSQTLCRSFLDFDRKIPGFISSGLAVAPETRTSSPLRMSRHPQTLESIGVRGLYPLGEGAGYAGGIVSSAADGLRFASLARLRKERL